MVAVHHYLETPQSASGYHSDENLMKVARLAILTAIVVVPWAAIISVVEVVSQR
jgi:hypothetical protein